ncbi:hypothetical protein L7F22_056263 [Adiantum nelumboides]|nr:hypothetical protein [Adiantum nelumboides]
MQLPRKPHLDVVKRTLRYVSATLNYALFYEVSTELQLSGFTDADWAGSVCDRRSTNGFMFSLGSAAIIWSRKKQPTVALSSTEAEYRGAAVTACEVAWLELLLGDLGIQCRGRLSFIATTLTAYSWHETQTFMPRQSILRYDVLHVEEELADMSEVHANMLDVAIEQVTDFVIFQVFDAVGLEEDVADKESVDALSVMEGEHAFEAYEEEPLKAGETVKEADSVMDVDLMAKDNYIMLADCILYAWALAVVYSFACRLEGSNGGMEWPVASTHLLVPFISSYNAPLESAATLELHGQDLKVVMLQGAAEGSPLSLNYFASTSHDNFLFRGFVPTNCPHDKARVFESLQEDRLRTWA